MEHAYQIGRWRGRMPIPPIQGRCQSIDAGPVTFVVEARHLSDEILQATHPSDLTIGTPGYDDFGASLHVFGTADGLEHLRFDCFSKDPHYHYLRHKDHGHLVCRFDDIAEDSEFSEWVMTRVRTRLPEMLAFAGQEKLADTVRSELALVLTGADEIPTLLKSADEQALAERDLLNG
jgi:hypothetical protein